MKAIYIALFFTSIPFFGLAQAPFTTVVREPRLIELSASVNNKDFFKPVTDSQTITNFVANQSQIGFLTSTSHKSAVKAKDSAGDDQTVVPTEADEEIDFFKNNTLALNILNEGENRMAISSQVLQYKLYFADPSAVNSTRKWRYNLPLMVIAKLSSNYDQENSSSSLDVLDYEASPITIRVMPSWKLSSDNFADALFLGFYTDARALNIYEQTDDSYDLKMMGSAGVGFTYQGNGQAGYYNEDGEYETGRFSISVILQGAIGDKELVQKLFDTEEEYVGSLQSYFLFKVSKKSSLNIKVGYQHFFQRTAAGSKNCLSVAIGI